jgi:hypothetical protein
MPDGPRDGDVEPDDGGNPEDGKILSPDELDIADDEHVEQLDESRFVVSPEARTESGQARPRQSGPDTATEPSRSPDRPTPPQQGASPRPRQEPTGGRSGTDGAATGELTREQVHRWLEASFEGGSRYGFDVTATFDGTVSQRRMASNDVVTIFESLVLWYAQQVDNDTPVEEILGILLMEANVPVQYPSESLKKLVKSCDLGPDDTIADLLAAVEKNDGVQL